MTSPVAPGPPVDMLRLTLAGRLDAAAVARPWPELLAQVAAHPDEPFRIDCTGVETIDGAGLALLTELSRRPRPPGLIETLGRSMVDGLAQSRGFVTFPGRATAVTFASLLHPLSVRRRDALPIVGLVSFLVGVILAFPAGNAMPQFGAILFVADLLGISITRELGPMKVNGEIDASDTMGLDPVRFLVVSRILAGLAVAPVLAVFSNVFGIVGGAVVRPLFGVIVAGAVVTGIVLIVVVEGLFSVAYFYLGI